MKNKSPFFIGGTCCRDSKDCDIRKRSFGTSVGQKGNPRRPGAIRLRSNVVSEAFVCGAVHRKPVPQRLGAGYETTSVAARSVCHRQMAAF